MLQWKMMWSKLLLIQKIMNEQQMWQLRLWFITKAMWDTEIEYSAMIPPSGRLELKPFRNVKSNITLFTRWMPVAAVGLIRCNYLCLLSIQQYMGFIFRSSHLSCCSKNGLCLPWDSHERSRRQQSVTSHFRAECFLRNPYNPPEPD